MSDALSALLSADLTIEKPVFIKRLNTDITVKAIDGKTLSKLQERATHYVGKGAKREAQLDEQKFGGLVIASASVSLDFGNAQLLEKYGASDAADCVQKALLAGEIAKLTQAIMEISGFNDLDDQVEDAKN
jgi:Phage XkdN-like tail assembly chaperone protein, TAC